MDITAKQVLELAAKYIGYKEKASNKDLYSFTDNAGCGNFTMFQAELDKAKFWNTPKNGYEWCTSFVAWCFWRIAGSEAKDILCLTGPYGASCVSWAKYYAAQARLFTKPQVGDQYFQKDTRDGLPCHTGIGTLIFTRTITPSQRANDIIMLITLLVSLPSHFYVRLIKHYVSK